MIEETDWTLRRKKSSKPKLHNRGVALFWVFEVNSKIFQGEESSERAQSNNRVVVFRLSKAHDHFLVERSRKARETKHSLEKRKGDDDRGSWKLRFRKI